MPSVTRRTRSTRAQRRNEMRDRLLAVVERLLAEGETYTEISVERMVSEAAISRSTFYAYFEDKGDLLRAWFAQIIEEIESAASAWWTLDGDATPADLRVALETIVLTYRPHTALMSAVYDASVYDASVRDEVNGMMARNTAGLRKHIRKGQKEGWILDELLPAETAAWLTWMAERGQHQMVTGAADAELAKLVDSYTDIVWNTLYGGARARA